MSLSGTSGSGSAQAKKSGGLMETLGSWVESVEEWAFGPQDGSAAEGPEPSTSDRSDEQKKEKDRVVWEEGSGAFESLGIKPYRFNPPLHSSIRLNLQQPRPVPGPDGPVDQQINYYGDGDVNTLWPEGTSRQSHEWRLGQIIGDNLTGGAFGGDDDEYRYGFRFLYNPASLSLGATLNKAIPPEMSESGGNFSIIQSGNMQTISLDLMLNRIPEVSGAPEYGGQDNLEPEQEEALRRWGTILDLEYLFRSQNGVWTVPDSFTQPVVVPEGGDVEAAIKEILGPTNFALAYPNGFTTGGEDEEEGKKGGSGGDGEESSDNLINTVTKAGEQEANNKIDTPEEQYARSTQEKVERLLSGAPGSNDERMFTAIYTADQIRFMAGIPVNGKTWPVDKFPWGMTQFGGDDAATLRSDMLRLLTVKLNQERAEKEQEQEQPPKPSTGKKKDD